MTESRRRRIELALGSLWLLDGGLQLQPHMFNKVFFEGVLGMANMGLPSWLSSATYHITLMLVAHPAVWNGVFGLLQVGIGLGLIWGRGRVATAARLGSVGWGLAVWVFGEGVGAMFMGGSSLLTGAPGSALLYSLLTVAIWPAPPGAAWPGARAALVRASWSAVWLGGALLELVSVNRAAGVPGAQIANGGFGEPGIVSSMDRAVGHVIAGGGLAFAAVLGVTAAAVAMGVWWEPTRRPALVVGVAVAAFVGLIGQNLGAVLTGQGTDPGSGPLLVLMAFSAWPAARPAATPVPRRRRIRTVPHRAVTAPA